MNPKTQYYVAASVDGFIADRDGKLDWLFQFGKADGVNESYANFIKDVGAVAMGSATYEFILGEKWGYEGIPAWVFTHRDLPRVPNADLRFTSEDVEKVHADMVKAAGGKNVWLIGGGKLVAQFAERGLLDEIHLAVMPVFLGGGAPLLPMSRTEPMVLERVTQFGMGAIELRYRLTGK